MPKYCSHHSRNYDFAYFHGYLDTATIYANHSMMLMRVTINVKLKPSACLCLH